jgi:hypothetical protein
MAQQPVPAHVAVPPVAARAAQQLPFSESPYRAALINAGVAAIGAAAIGIVSLYRDHKSESLEAFRDTVLTAVASREPALWDAFIIFCQVLLVIIYGNLIANFIWMNSDAFDRYPATRYVLVETVLTIVMLVCVYAAPNDIPLFRISSILVLLLWTVRCMIVPDDHPYKAEFSGSLKSYVEPLRNVALIAAAIVAILFFSAETPAGWRRGIRGVLDLLFSLTPLVWGAQIIYGKIWSKNNS